MNENVSNTDSGRRQECVQRNRETLEPEQQTPYRNDVDGCCPTHLDLFSGIGGFALAAKWAGFRTIGFCEIDKYCQKVLAKNFLADSEQQAGRIEHRRRKSCALENARNDIPGIHGDIFDLDGTQFCGVTLITGGFPCQPFSVAGKRRGAADDRAIWPEMFRVIKEARPAWVLGENVPGIIPMELDNVLSDLEGIGYATRSFVIPACAVDARHRRDRLWIVGRLLENSKSNGKSRWAARFESPKGKQSSCSPERPSGVSNTYQQGLEGQWIVARGTGTKLNDVGDHCRWLPEPAVCELVNGVSDGLVRYVGRVATKVPNRVQKLKALGNSILPQVAYEILREIRKLI